jgi:hypothetical protein
MNLTKNKGIGRVEQTDGQMATFGLELPDIQAPASSSFQADRSSLKTAHSSESFTNQLNPGACTLIGGLRWSRRIEA